MGIGQEKSGKRGCSHFEIAHGLFEFLQKSCEEKLT